MIKIYYLFAMSLGLLCGIVGIFIDMWEYWIINIPLLTYVYWIHWFYEGRIKKLKDKTFTIVSE